MLESGRSALQPCRGWMPDLAALSRTISEEDRQTAHPIGKAGWILRWVQAKKQVVHPPSPLLALPQMLYHPRVSAISSSCRVALE